MSRTLVGSSACPNRYLSARVFFLFMPMANVRTPFHWPAADTAEPHKRELLLPDVAHTETVAATSYSVLPF